MQCKNCGSHYRMRDLACPYCGTENALGKVWMKQRTDAELSYERERIAAGKRWSPYIYNRTISRVIVVEVVLFILLIASVVVFYAGKELVYSRLTNKRNQEAIQEMETLLEEKRYGELEAYWNDYRDSLNSNDPKVRKLSQVASVTYYHNSYLDTKLSFFGLTEEEKREDDFILQYSIRSAWNVYTYEESYWDDLCDEAKEMLGVYKGEIHAYLVGYLKLTEEEFEEFVTQDYMYYSDSDKWVELVRERNGWND